MGHISTVNRRTLPPSVNKGFLATTGSMGSQWPKTVCDLFSDILSTRKGDKIFFQMTGRDPRAGKSLSSSNKPSNYLELINSDADIKAKGNKEDLDGFIGILEISGKPFFDKEDVKAGENAVVESSIPIRAPLNCKKLFPSPVSEERALIDVSDPGELWNPKFKKALQGAKSLTSISPEETEKLERMIYKENDFSYDVNQEEYPGNRNNIISIDDRLHQDEKSLSQYSPDTIRDVELDKIPISSGNSFRYEKTLEAWLMEMIDEERKDLEEIRGPKEEIEWFTNYVPYGITGSNMDGIIFHKRDDTRYKVSVIELKKGECGREAVKQVINYSKWVSKYLCGGDEEMVQPILISGGFRRDTVSNVEKSVGSMSPHLVEYRIEDEEVVLDKLD